MLLSCSSTVKTTEDTITTTEKEASPPNQIKTKTTKPINRAVVAPGIRKQEFSNPPKKNKNNNSPK
jgi:hypothetical protein